MTIDIDEVKVERNELGLWLGWTLATAGGILLGFLPTLFLVNMLNLGLAQIVVPVFAGTLVGLAQWVALRRFLTAHSDWILAGGTSWALVSMVGLFVIQNLPGTVFAGIAGYLLFGTIVALVQWLPSCAARFLSSTGLDARLCDRRGGRFLGQPGSLTALL